MEWGVYYIFSLKMFIASGFIGADMYLLQVDPTICRVTDWPSAWSPADSTLAVVHSPRQSLLAHGKLGHVLPFFGHCDLHRVLQQQGPQPACTPRKGDHFRARSVCKGFAKYSLGAQGLLFQQTSRFGKKLRSCHLRWCHKDGAFSPHRQRRMLIGCGPSGRRSRYPSVYRTPN